MPKMSPAMERLLAKQAEQRRAAAEGAAAASSSAPLQQQSSSAAPARLGAQAAAPASPAPPAAAAAAAAAPGLLSLGRSKLGALGGLGGGASPSPLPASPYSSAYPATGSPRNLPPVAAASPQQPAQSLNLRASAGAAGAVASPLARKLSPLPPASQGPLL